MTILSKKELRHEISKACGLDNSNHALVQGVQICLGYAKCNALKLRKVCERSELRLQKDPIKRGKLVILMM